MSKNMLSLKTRSAGIGLSMLVVMSSSAYAAQTPVAPQIDAKAFVLMDYDSGKILASSHPDERLDPASLNQNYDELCGWASGQSRKNYATRYGDCQ
ncbi:D-alanyl-D-alanine carboxypeptidase dacC precursor [Providencia rustigianii]|nr:D-alanyl-D-alanine carboxypeptidase dacC precursor [Providencia rustigianii]